MLHQIALFSNSATLNLVYLDKTGVPQAFTQNATGVWASAKAPGPIPANVTFKGLAGLYNVLFAMDQGGKLWSISQDAGGKWANAGFQALPDSAATSNGYTDFAITPMRGQGVVVAGGTSGSAYTQFGPLQGPLTAPSALTYVEGPTVAASATSLTPQGGLTAVVLGSTANLEINITTCAYSTDGATWLSSTTPENVDYPEIAAIATGNGGALQAIVLSNNLQSNGGVPCLMWDSSGNGSNWTWYGPLPNPAGVSFISVAAASGVGGGSLQVVGIGAADGMPYLIWQNAQGTWFPYSNPNGGGMKLPYNGPQIQDLAIGVGGMGSQGYLQVGYIGTDGKIYVNYQDPSGTWGSYGPLP